MRRRIHNQVGLYCEDPLCQIPDIGKKPLQVNRARSRNVTIVVLMNHAIYSKSQNFCSLHRRAQHWGSLVSEYVAVQAVITRQISIFVGCHCAYWLSAESTTNASSAIIRNASPFRTREVTQANQTRSLLALAFEVDRHDVSYHARLSAACTYWLVDMLLVGSTLLHRSNNKLCSSHKLLFCADNRTLQ
eukprot:gnl/Hemi2/3334_TR1165_c0_g1_i1.p2 gnl/Hemi2/3334_TR1165_c0_g1~~gnl/Hemi2/3334_TR1165_c0_g1_i1.p2  ORF type:complete len:189 (+),score=6.01 gnl/Hemi2/3334_TR1165_c0_g1_i1:178-744(+)